MGLIDVARLKREEDALREEFHSKKPFRWLVMENFLIADAAQKLYEEFPPVDPSWVDAAGLHTRNKYTQPVVNDTIAAQYYQEANAPEFLELMGRITGINDLLPDANLFGAGYHQILDGGFLNVHVDFNRIDEAGLDRRLNLLVYLNPDWQESNGGQLELWDMETKTLLASVLPTYNRAVIFETNEISYHGHPKPLKTGGRMTRKSLSAYYYTQGRDDITPAETHSALFVYTDGVSGTVKTLNNGVQEAFRRLTGRKTGAK